MILLQIFLLSSSFCLLPTINGYVHYGIEPESDNGVPDEGEVIRIFHSHGAGDHDSGSSSESGSDSGSNSSSSSSSSSEFDSGSGSSSSSSSESDSSSSASSSSSGSGENDSDLSRLRVKFMFFGEPVQVNLKRVDSHLAGTNTPVWLAEGSGDGEVTFTRADVNALGKAFSLYQDHQTDSSIMLIRDEDGDAYFLGVIAGYNIRRQPVYRQKKRSTQRRSPIDGYTVSDPHYVTRSRKRRVARSAIASALESRRKRETVSPEKTIYPEILVATDYDLGFTSTSSEEFYDHLIYILAFFNGVDLLFEDIHNPDIRLHIAGIIVSANRAAVPYIHNNLAPDGSIDGKKAAAGAGPFYSEKIDSSELPAGSYDIVITLTNTYICDQTEADICTPLITGVSTIHPVCENNYPVVNMAAILEDDLAFSGTRIGGHELGHIMGAGHDGEADEGGGDCNFEDGYIMSRYNENSTVSLQWSACSKKSLSKELSQATADCLRNIPDWKKDGKNLPPLLPADIKDTNAQCQTLGYVRACLGPNICNSLECTNDPFLVSTNCEKVGVPATQGVYCGFNQHCINGECTQAYVTNADAEE